MHKYEVENFCFKCVNFCFYVAPIFSIIILTLGYYKIYPFLFFGKYLFLLFPIEMNIYGNIDSVLIESLVLANIFIFCSFLLLAIRRIFATITNTQKKYSRIKVGIVCIITILVFFAARMCMVYELRDVIFMNFNSIINGRLFISAILCIPVFACMTGLGLGGFIYVMFPVKITQDK